MRLPDFASQLGGGLSVSAANLTASAVSSGIGMAAGALSRGDRFQRGARQGMNAAREEGMSGRDVAKAAVMRGTTESLRPGLTGRRFEDARMSNRARRYVGEMKRTEDARGSAPTPGAKPAPSNKDRAASVIADIKKNEATT